MPHHFNPPPVRVSRVFAYCAFAAAGATSIAWPVPAVAEATTGARYLALVWAGMLTTGGVLSALGAAVDRWIGEYVGLLPMIATFAIYALTVAVSGSLPSAAACTFLTGVALVLFSRWREVAHVRAEVARRRAAQGGR